MMGYFAWVEIHFCSKIMTNEEKLKNTFDYILSRYFIMLLLFYAELGDVYLSKW